MGVVISVFPEGIYIFDGYGIFEMILKNPNGKKKKKSKWKY